MQPNINIHATPYQYSMNIIHAPKYPPVNNQLDLTLSSAAVKGQAWPHFAIVKYANACGGGGGETILPAS